MPFFTPKSDPYDGFKDDRLRLQALKHRQFWRSIVWIVNAAAASPLINLAVTWASA